MTQYQHLPIYKLSYDLTLELMKVIKDFPRDFKYTLGQKLKSEAIELVVYVARANASQHKTTHIETFQERLQVVQMMVRLAHDLKILARNRYINLSEMIDKLGKQSTGWLKHSKAA